MSISASLSNALSGLKAASRQAEVISSNVSNALTPGYARRWVELSAESLAGRGAGVRVDGVTREVDQYLVADRRVADAAAANSGLRTAFMNGLEKAIGAPGEDGSLSDQFAALDAAFIEAASRPDSQARLQQIISTASSLSQKFNALSDTIQQSRMTAEDEISNQVEDLSRSLKQIDQLNSDILAQRSAGRDASALMDQRQQAIDHVAEIVPIREVARNGNQVAIYTTGGAALLDGNPAVIGFNPVSTITADMTKASGALSGLTVNGRQIDTSEGGPLGGGTLGAQFAIRDEMAPDVQI